LTAGVDGERLRDAVNNRMTNVNDNKKDEIVSVRLSRRALTRIQRVAAKQGVKVGEFLRVEAMKAVDRVEGGTNGA